jgi:hypothetical protein
LDSFDQKDNLGVFLMEFNPMGGRCVPTPFFDANVLVVIEKNLFLFYKEEARIVPVRASFFFTATTLRPPRRVRPPLG